jgi:hypothetical protein
LGLARSAELDYCLGVRLIERAYLEQLMVDPFDWAELQRLVQNVTAAHISMVAFLEGAYVPWSDDQTLEFERIAAAQLAALNEYTAFTRQDGPAVPGTHPWIDSWSDGTPERRGAMRLSCGTGNGEPSTGNLPRTRFCAPGG